LIVVVLFLATARVIMRSRMPETRDGRGGHRHWPPVLVEYRYPALGVVTANELHRSGERSSSPNAHLFKVAFR